MTTSVIAGLVTGPGRLELREFEAGPPPPGAVTVDISLCGICGTDVASFRSGSLHSPAVCGHEWVGVLSAIGRDVADRSEGDRVVIAVRPPCGRCAECLAGLADHCRTALDMARGRDPLAPPHGGFAPQITVDALRVVPAHPALSDQQAAQVEPAAVAFHGVRRSRIAPGDAVVVQGAGPVGLLAAQLARAVGAGSVVVVEPSAVRRQLALSLGIDLALAPGEEATELVRERTGGLGPDVVLECAGVPGLLQGAVDLVRRGGTVTLLSYLAQPDTISPSRWLAKEVTVVGTVAFAYADLHRTMALLADGRVQVEPLVTRTVGLTGLEAALQDLAAASTDDVKVLVDPR